MSIADKLIYLNTTKEKLKDSINNIGGSITNETTFRAYATELDNIYSSLPKTTGEGSNLSLSTIKGRINVDDILGDTQQFTTTGKNYFMPTLKINNTNIIQQRCSVTLSGDEFTFVATGTDIYFGNVVAVGSSYGENCGVLIEIPTGVTKTTITTTNTAFDGLYYTFYDSDKKSLGYGRAYATGTNIVENAKYLGVRIGVATATSGNTYKTKVMVTFGNVDNTYEPYTNGASPNPTYPQDINVVTGQQEVLVRGKNYINRETCTENVGLAFVTGATFGENGSITSDYIRVFPNMEFACNYRCQKLVYDKDKNYLGTIQVSGILAKNGDSANTSITATIPNDSDIYYLRVGIRTTYNTGVNLLTADLQLNLGSTATTYVPYQEQTKIVNLSSKNLFNITSLQQGIIGTTTLTYANDILTLKSGAYGSSFANLETKTLKANTQYIYELFLTETSTNSAKVSLIVQKEGSTNIINGGQITFGDQTYYSFTYTPTEDTNLLRLQFYNSSTTPITADISFKVQLREASSTSGYEPYYNYELSKIGTYQDRIYKNNDKWYIEKNIGKHTFTGASSESWGISQTGTANWFYNITNFNTDLIQPFNSGNDNAFSNYYEPKSITSSSTYQGFYIGGNSSSHLGFLRVRYGTEDTVANYKTWLQTHNLTIYYVLYTPTYEEITNESLIEELNELEKLMSYNGTTNINISGNLPMILSVSALKGE